MIKLFVSILFLLILNACSSVILKPDMDSVEGKSSAFKTGFKQGCTSGYLAGGSLVHSFRRDTNRMAEDQEYKDGWKHGYRYCKEEFREMCRSKEWISKSHLYCSDVRQQGLDKVEEAKDD